MADASASEKVVLPPDDDLKAEQRTVTHDIQQTEQPLKTRETGEDDEETCGFCKFMKAGGCHDTFINWMECVDREKAKGNDFVETCMTQIQELRECMLANADYYKPMLDDEEEYLDQREEETEQNSTLSDSNAPVEKKGR